jgi:uncharacterized membrane protein
MNLAHLHLLLNHFPTVGTVIGLGLFLVALAGKNDDLKKASLAIFFAIALLAIPVYMTGNAAQEAIADRSEVSAASMERHQAAALLAFMFMELAGVLAWLGLWQYRRNSRPASWTLPAVLIVSLLTFGLMARAANMGGEIRHPEILATESAAAEATGVEGGILAGSSVATWVLGNSWVWPASETLHFIGLALLFGVVLVVNLRMLGMMKNVSFVALHLLPWGLLGFVINLVTGMLFFVSTPDQYTQNVAFYWKMILVLLAGVNLLYLTVFDKASWSLEPGAEAPLLSKIVAGSAIALWLGVIYLGRMLPFLGNSF